MKNEDEINAAIKVLVEKIDKDVKAEEVLKYSQSALNLAHTIATLKGSER